MAKTNWDPYSDKPPPPPPPPSSLVNLKTKPVSFPPPPSRTSSVASPSLSSSSSVASSPPPLPSRGQSGAPPPLPRRTPISPAPPVIRLSPSQPNPPPTNGPPPIVRSTRPDFHARPKPPTSSSEREFDWSNLSPEDKTTFFNWLDEFFSNFTPPSTNSDAAVARRPAIATSSHALPLQSSVSYPSFSACVYIQKFHTHIPNDKTLKFCLRLNPLRLGTARQPAVRDTTLNLVLVRNNNIFFLFTPVTRSIHICTFLPTIYKTWISCTRLDTLFRSFDALVRSVV